MVGAEIAEAAVRAQKAGFDGVQIHAVHGFWLNRLISPAFNHRADEYGKDRYRILEDIYRAVRSAANKSFSIWIKINCQGFIPGGLSEQECIKNCARLSEQGIDAVEIIGNARPAGM